MGTSSSTRGTPASTRSQVQESGVLALGAIAFGCMVGKPGKTNGPTDGDEDFGILGGGGDEFSETR